MAGKGDAFALFLSEGTMQFLDFGGEVVNAELSHVGSRRQSGGEISGECRLGV